MVKRCLNVGCGNDYHLSDKTVEWTNIDISTTCHTDLVCHVKDIDKHFGEGYFDQLEAVQVFEHLERDDYIQTLRALYWVCANGATWNIVVPHGFSDNFITDPTHKLPFSPRSFDFFIDGKQLRENGVIYGWEDIKLEEVRTPEIDGNSSIHFLLKVVK
jgi:hypothetical protein